MKMSLWVLLLFIFSSLAMAQTTTGCPNCVHGPGPQGMTELHWANMVALELKIVKAVQENTAKCSSYKFNRVDDIVDVYSILSIEFEAKKKVGMQPSSASCQDCQAIKSCAILNDEIKENIKTLLNDFEIKYYIAHTEFRKNILIPSLFIKKFKKLMKEIDADK